MILNILNILDKFKKSITLRKKNNSIKVTDAITV